MTVCHLTEWWRANPKELERARRWPELLTLDTGQKWGDAGFMRWHRTAYENALGFPDAPGADKPIGECCTIVGGGKDQLIAAIFLALLHFGPPGALGYMQSTDRDKSKAVVACVRGFIRRSPPVGAGIEITRDQIRGVCPGCSKVDCIGCTKGPGSRAGVVVCEALDGPSTSGAIYDLAILNEVQEWPSPHGPEVYSHIFARRNKRKGRFVCFTNAPRTGKGEWRRDRWEEARRSGSDWWYVEAKLAQCPWISQAEVELQRRNLPSTKFKRWYELIPSEGVGDLLTDDEIERAVFPELGPAAAPTAPGRRYMGVDVGVKHDHCALVLLRASREGAVVLERIETWVPDAAKGLEVDLAEVEAALLRYGREWRAKVMLDPYQAQSMRQALEAQGVQCEVIDATAANLTEQAHALLELFRSSRVRLFPNAGFVRIDEDTTTSLAQQLREVDVKEQERGVRLVHRRTKAGHGDQASAFALAALGVLRGGVIGQPVTSGSSTTTKAGTESRSRRISGLRAGHTGRYTGPRATSQRRRSA